ncbi:MAG: xanthine dehydrogenase family protein subunit M [Deltaproteobacteria bacterium]|nr:xanthine dehydrogenase family protein subunit M [Deltaproteobacteria bacterium]
MLLPTFDYYEPSSLKEACEVMTELGSRARLLAGGTDLIVNMKKKIISPEHVVALGRLEALKKTDATNGTVKIGALMTAAEIAESAALGQQFSALRQAASSLGSPLIRNLATIAGNLVSARPAADLPPSLMAYGARLIIKKKDGERKILLEDFIKGPGDTELAPEEILAEIEIDRAPGYSGASYIKLGTRKALEISLVNVASFITLEAPDGVITSARIVMGAVGPTPLRAPSAEKILVGEKPSVRLFERAGRAAAEESRPIDDFRGSAQYRRDMVDVLTRRALAAALQEARRQ